MYVGILTAPFGDTPLEHVAAFAGEYGFGGLEIITGPGSKHIDTNSFDGTAAKSVLALMEKRNLQISALAGFADVTHADPTRRAANINTVRRAIEIAKMLDVKVITTLAGLPPNGKDRFKTIEEDCVEVFPALLDYAAKHDVKLACENWYATNIQHLGHWDRLFELVPHPNFGLNFDPSHLYWQGIDHIAAIEKYASRIFHCHAKDTEVLDAKLKVVGNQGDGWWRYVIPGLGRIHWGQHIATLRRCGYNGALSIEHEDGAIGREEGFLVGKKNLELYFEPGMS